MILIRPTKKNQYIFILESGSGVIEDIVYNTAPSKPGPYNKSSIAQDRYEKKKKKFEERKKELISFGYRNSGHFVFDGTIKIDGWDSKCLLENGKEIPVVFASDNYGTVLEKLCDGTTLIKGQMIFSGIWQVTGQTGTLYVQPAELI